jgi:hypothetical protein
MNASASAPSSVAEWAGGTGGGGAGGSNRDVDRGIGAFNVGGVHVVITARVQCGSGRSEEDLLALEGPALGCRLDASSEVGAGDMDPHSMLRRSSSLAIRSANHSDWAFCLSLAMGGPRLSTIDQGIRVVLRQ